MYNLGTICQTIPNWAVLKVQTRKAVTIFQYIVLHQKKKKKNSPNNKELN